MTPISDPTPVHNQDIIVSDDIVSLFPSLKPILVSEHIEREFEIPEKAANLNKKFFHSFGLISLILIVLVLIFLVWRLGSMTIGLSFPHWMIWTSASMGALSFILALLSFLFGFQKKWLYNRFITERLRQFKLQLLLDGNLVELAAASPEQFKSELIDRLKKFKFEFAYKGGAMDDFIEAEDFKLFVEPIAVKPGAVAQEVYKAYEALRLDYQVKYFKLKRNALIDLDEWTNGLAKFSLLFAGLLAFAELIVSLFVQGEFERKYGWYIAASAVSIGLLSAGVRVFRGARALAAESERYASKWIVLKILGERFRNPRSDAEEKLDIMIETERICIEELREFLIAFQKSDYLF